MVRSERPRTGRVGYYFAREKRLLSAVAVTGIVYNVGLAAGPWFEGQMVQALCDILAGTRSPSEMVALAAAYVLTILCVQATRYCKRLTVRKFANNTGKRMKLILYRNLLYRKQARQEQAGEMMARLIADADACVEGMRKATTEVFDTGVVMIAYLIMLLSRDWRLALLCMIFPPIAYALAEKLKKTVTGSVARSRESAARLNAATLDRVGGALTYRACGQEQNRDRAYERRLRDYEKKAVRANIWENAMQPVYQVIALLSTIFIVWFGGKNVLGTGWTAWNVAAFTTFFSCYLKLAAKTSKAAKLFNAVQKAQVSWRRVRPYLDAPPEPPEEETGGGVLSVRDLRFAYPGQAPLFSGVTFQARPGQIVGLTGAVACGKSTLGRLFTGELPYEGEIALGGRQLPRDGGQYAAGVGYLGHQPELFSATIEENICLGKPGDVWGVLRAVCMDEEVSALPGGIHTRIGSGGVRLSGGQQARIALARTLYHARPLMVLDDPFAGVDMDTEAKIFANLRRLAGGSVIVLISHRLALFPRLDRVLWMERGTVLPASHRELMERREGYRALYLSQRKEGDAP